MGYGIILIHLQLKNRIKIMNNVNNENNELTYIKEKFLNKFKLNIIFSNANSNDPAIVQIIDLQKQCLSFQKDILNSTNENELLSHLNQINEAFIQASRSTFRLSNNYAIKSIFNQFFRDTNVVNFHNWVAETKEVYNDKIKFDFFNKITNIFSHNDPLENLKQSVINNNKILLDFDVHSLSQNLIKKYDLSYINLSSVSNNEEAINLLKKFDDQCEKMAKDMNMPNSHIGLHGTLGIEFNDQPNLACYSTTTKRISLNSTTINSSIILHEWIHAVDNYVCSHHTNKNSFVSEQDSVLVINDNSPMSIAYQAIKDITKDIFNNNKKEMEIIIEEKTKLGLSKFWSIIIGPEWYGLTEEKKQSFFHSDIKSAVTNYLVDPDDLQFVEQLDIQIRKQGYFTSAQAQEKLQNHYFELKETVIPYFQDIEQNVIGKKSIYFKLADISNYFILTGNSITAMTDKVKEFFNKEPITEKIAVFNSGYFVEPCEMVARYFESQVYSKKALLFNLSTFTGAYKMTKDKDFTEKKDALLNFVFDKKTTMNKINSLRTDYFPEIHNSPQLKK